MSQLRTWFSCGLDRAGFTVELDDLAGLFQPKEFFPNGFFPKLYRDCAIFVAIQAITVLKSKLEEKDLPCQDRAVRTRIYFLNFKFVSFSSFLPCSPFLKIRDSCLFSARTVFDFKSSLGGFDMLAIKKRSKGSYLKATTVLGSCLNFLIVETSLRVLRL